MHVYYKSQRRVHVYIFLGFSQDRYRETLMYPVSSQNKIEFFINSKEKASDKNNVYPKPSGELEI